MAELRDLGLRPEQVLDFSSNINPLGPSQRVKRAAVEVDLAAYPDRDCLALRECLSEKLRVGIDNLVIGNGSTDLIHLLARAYLRPGDECHHSSSNIRGVRIRGLHLWSQVALC